MSHLGVRHAKAALSSGCKSHPAIAPAGICCVLRSNRRSLLMLPHQVTYLVPVLIASIFFGSFYINMRRAKKQVVHWKGYSTWLFFRSNGVALTKRAKLVWMKEEGYDEAEALIIAKYQSRAVVCVLVGWVIVVVLAANIIEC
jgi:hypothetical protein